MESQELFNKVICDVNCRFGAPMGRYSDRLENKPNEKIYNRKVNLSQGYDKGGAYWGNPNNLRVMYNKDLTYVCFYRLY